MLDIRVTYDRPKWVLVEEAHHMLPRGRDAGDGENIDAQVPTIFVTVHPDTLAKGALRSLGTVLIIGRDSLGLIKVLSRTLGQPYPRLPEHGPEVGEAIYWECRGDAPPVGSSPSTSEGSGEAAHAQIRRRHAGRGP